MLLVNLVLRYSVLTNHFSPELVSSLHMLSTQTSIIMSLRGSTDAFYVFMPPYQVRNIWKGYGAKPFLFAFDKSKEKPTKRLLKKWWFCEEISFTNLWFFFGGKFYYNTERNYQEFEADKARFYIVHNFPKCIRSVNKTCLTGNRTYIIWVNKLMETRKMRLSYVFSQEY